MISVFVVITASICIAGWLIYSVWSFAPWVPTFSRDLSIIVEASDLRPGETLVDLGSGDGRVVLALAREFPDTQFRGVEISMVLYLISRLGLWRSGLDNVTFVRGDLYRQDYCHCDVLYIFGVVRTMNGRILREVVPQLRSGARIISYNFKIDGWLGKNQRYTTKGHATIYRYEV